MSDLVVTSLPLAGLCLVTRRMHTDQRGYGMQPHLQLMAFRTVWCK
jgi:hypothetical protein